MHHLVLSAVTGIGGFDPAPLLIAVAALAAGARRRALVALTVVLLGGTAAWGIVLTLLAGPAVSRIDWWHLARSGDVAAAIELIAGLVLIGVAAVRLVRALRRRSAGPEQPVEEPARLLSAPRAAAIALGFVAIVIADPAFSVQVVASAEAPWPLAVLGWVLWTVVSQSPLVVASPLLLGRGGVRAAERLGPWTRRLPELAGPVVTAAMGCAGLLMIADAAARLLHGSFLVG